MKANKQCIVKQYSGQPATIAAGGRFSGFKETRDIPVFSQRVVKVNMSSTTRVSSGLFFQGEHHPFIEIKFVDGSLS